MARRVLERGHDPVRHGPGRDDSDHAGKLFAGCYALFSGLALITTVAVIFAPLFHRFLHKFHLDTDAHEEGS